MKLMMVGICLLALGYTFCTSPLVLLPVLAVVGIAGRRPDWQWSRGGGWYDASRGGGGLIGIAILLALYYEPLLFIVVTGITLVTISYRD